jgi:hypothetical protein
MNFELKRIDAIRTSLLVVCAVSAVFFTVGAAINLKLSLSGSSAMSHLGDMDAPMPKIVIKSTPLLQQDYQLIADRIHILYPDVSAVATANSLLLTSNSPYSYQNWRLALSETIPHSGGSIWGLKNFCAGTCDGAYFKSEIVINRNAVDVVSI